MNELSKEMQSKYLRYDDGVNDLISNSKTSQNTRTKQVDLFEDKHRKLQITFYDEQSDKQSHSLVASSPK